MTFHWEGARPVFPIPDDAPFFVPQKILRLQPPSYLGKASVTTDDHRKTREHQQSKLRGIPNKLEWNDHSIDILTFGLPKIPE